jgi:hypothetical protein
MKKYYIIIATIIILALVALAIVFFRDIFINTENSLDMEKKDMEEKEEMITILELLIKDPDTETTSLKAVDGSTSSGVAYRLFKNGEFNHLVIANLPDPENDNLYEGWLVQLDPLEFFSTGVMEKSKEGWVLIFTGDEEFSDYYRVVITEETVIDSLPEKHIIEGDF